MTQRHRSQIGVTKRKENTLLDTKINKNHFSLKGWMVELIFYKTTKYIQHCYYYAYKQASKTPSPLFSLSKLLKQKLLFATVAGEAK